MKTDNYLSLCLEQAARSPLHYRHGAIIVRGGKVIGHGFNDYRPGFNGGALKHGRIAHGSLDGEAMKELKAKLNKKKQQKQRSDHQQLSQSSSTFTPFEDRSSMGGGHSVNQPLSMHSEMMAIYSALPHSSSTKSSTTFSREKPYFKLSGGDKRKARLRRDLLMAYVAAVSPEAAYNKSKEYNDNNKDERENVEMDPLARALSDAGAAFHGTQNGEQHHQKLKNQKYVKGQNEKKKGYQYQYEYGRYGSQTQYGQRAQAQPSVSKSRRASGEREKRADDLRDHDAMKTSDDNDKDTTVTTSSGSAASTLDQKRKKDYKRSGKMRTSPYSDDDLPSSQPTLLPTGRAGENGSNLSDRRKYRSLKGADLYVARLGWSGKSSKKPRKDAVSTPPPPPAPSIAGYNTLSSSTSSLSSLSTTSSHVATGSLHDELTNREPSPSPANARPKDTCGLHHSKIHASRPCYRCMAFMESFGIRRVFWTNDAGQWEGGKVAALVESIDGGMEDVEGVSGGPTGNGLFVTKHEVLMLRRMMGQK
ncbi:hypothetical protein DOTSEDRAFT_55053 [Lecanosticta acicola]|uniref:CMP/dCMP-type deaminase domain-containing protein n=1 Tax=Lecanosticta acicola TaxID=111012 RepID=A0AAI8YSJ9_9PEZI|nr:hypothetical protein DOTSEDRAFT_55053 [Lecanosticta acicola]